MIPIEVSARHIHLKQEHLEALFEQDELTPARDLKQPKNFAAEETVTLKHEDQQLKEVRIVGPCRPETQVELSRTDSIFLGIEAPLRKSGALEDTPGLTLVGPEGELELEQGVIVPWRHIHAAPEQAQQLRVEDGNLVSVEVKGERAITFHRVQVRVDEDYELSMHLDTDEGNAAGITEQGRGELIRC